jgi:putative hydrolase of the HAD superfamily
MSRYRAVLFDAFGTLIELDRPAQRLRAALRARLGIDIPEQRAQAAMRAEIAHYAAGCRWAADRTSLERLRGECAAVMMGELELDACDDTARSLLGDAVRFRAYPDAPPALRAAAGHGLATAVVSNADCSLGEALREAGLEVGEVVDSATSGSAKPDPAIFLEALRRLGVGPGEALHVGDTPELDAAGARAAGIDVVIVDRRERPAAGTIPSLLELEPLLA